MHIVAIIHGDRNGYSVSFPDLPGCISAGDTEQDALDNAVEAMAFHLDGLREDGASIPVLRSIDQLRADPEFSDDFAGHAAIALLPFDQPSRVTSTEMTPTPAPSH